MNKQVRIDAISKEIASGTGEFQSTMKTISIIALAIEQLISNPEVIKIIATTVVDIEAEMIKQKLS